MHKKIIYENRKTFNDDTMTGYRDLKWNTVFLIGKCLLSIHID